VRKDDGVRRGYVESGYARMPDPLWWGCIATAKADT
jgi:hypothetical protein